MERTVGHQHIFLKLFVLGVVAVGMILGSLFWLTGRIDRLERETTQDLVALMVTESVDQVHASVDDYAHWDLAYDIVQAGDRDAIYEHLGTGATESDLFDQLLILSPERAIDHVFDGTGSVLPLSQFDLGGLAPFLAALSQHAPSDYVSVSGIGQVNGVYGAIAASWITADRQVRGGADRSSILVGIVQFDDDKLQAIAQLTQGTGYAIQVSPMVGELPSVALSGPNGEAVAQLIWTPHDLGTMLRTEVLPGILLVCLGIFAICLSAARYFHKQSKMLERAHTIASTDQLTGLMNRSGLDDVLSMPAVKTRVKAGHVAIVFLDLNDFKKLNDERGHKDGDRALVVTGQRLQASIRACDHVVRLGGDEFICLIMDENPRAAADLVAQRISQTCNDPIDFADHQTVLRPSIGVAVSSEGIDWETLLGQADAAMYLAKRSKADGPVSFCAELSENLSHASQAQTEVA